MWSAKFQLRTITVVLNVFYALTVLLFLLDALTGFDIKSDDLKGFIYIGIMPFTPAILLWNLVFMRQKTQKLLGTALPALMLIAIIIVRPADLVFASTAWKTQTVMYRHGHFSFKTVEFQVRNVGAIGYRKRTVEVFYLTKYFMITSTPPKDIDGRLEWLKVNEEVNEAGLK